MDINKNILVDLVAVYHLILIRAKVFLRTEVNEKKDNPGLVSPEIT